MSLLLSRIPAAHVAPPHPRLETPRSKQSLSQMGVEETPPRMASSSSQRSRSADEAALEDPDHEVDDEAKQLSTISSSSSSSKHRHSRRHPRNNQLQPSQDLLQLRRFLVFPSVKSQNRRWMLQLRQ